MSNMKKGKSGLLLAGVLAAGASLLLFNSSARSKVKETPSKVKDSVNKYKETYKEDPQGTRQALMTRLQNATEISKEAVTKIQEILDNQVKDVRDTTKDVASDAKTIREDAMSIVDTAKDAQGELKEVKDKAMDAKDEVMGAKDDVQEKTEKTSGSSSSSNSSNTTKSSGRHNSPGQETDHSVIKDPIN